MWHKLETKGLNCTGCGACFNICPKNAITMRENPQGFLYPHINTTLCVHCTLCDRTCPKLNFVNQNSFHPDCYAVRASDEVRAVSSSGGVFTLCANWILNQKGIVCGAAMEKDFSVHHIIVENFDDLKKLRGSKYVQSNTEQVYKECEVFLRTGRKLLFTGTPCQVAAARNYFERYREQVFYVDVFCHGVPSEKMWKDYVQENFGSPAVERIEFRSKLNGWRSEQLRVFYADSSSERIQWGESAYEEGFQRNIALRDGCEDCEFSGFQRTGDISIGDYWHVEDNYPELNDKKGTSVVLVNNAYGVALFEAIKDTMYHCKKTSIEDAARFNRLHQKYPPHPQKKRFLEFYPSKQGFSKAVWQVRHNLFDIGLVAPYQVPNYGGELTQFCLYTVLREMGYSVIVVPPPENTKQGRILERFMLFRENPYPREYLAPFYPDISDMKFLNLQTDTFIVGSDQLFNNNLYLGCGKYQALGFVNDSKKKIAYAMSFGHEKIWGEKWDNAEEAYYIKKFDAISVREKSAVSLLKREFDVHEVTFVLDPVFLMRMADYETLMKKAEPCQQKYLMCYILNGSKEIESLVNDFSATHNLTAITVSDFEDLKFGREMYKWEKTPIYPKLEDWISLIKNADFVITDSFHATCLAILFHKPFFTLVNRLRGETRFKSILELLNLTNRMFYSEAQLRKLAETVPSIDWEYVEKKLSAERERSMQWLKSKIDTPLKKKALSSYDILDKRIDGLSSYTVDYLNELNQKIWQMQKRIFDLEQQLRLSTK